MNTPDTADMIRVSVTDLRHFLHLDNKSYTGPVRESFRAIGRPNQGMDSYRQNYPNEPGRQSTMRLSHSKPGSIPGSGARQVHGIFSMDDLDEAMLDIPGDVKTVLIALAPQCADLGIVTDTDEDGDRYFIQVPARTTSIRLIGG